MQGFNVKKQFVIIFFIWIIGIILFVNNVYAVTDEDKKALEANEIVQYVNSIYSDNEAITNESNDVLQAWKQKLEEQKEKGGMSSSMENVYNKIVAHLNGNDKAVGLDDGTDSGDHPIYQQPRRNDNTDNASASLDDMMDDADNFVKAGGNVQYNEGALQNFSSNIYNILLTVGVAVAVIVGGILGIKLMLSSVEEKAETKRLLVAYAVGCVIVFGGFGIWKLVITILEGL